MEEFGRIWARIKDLVVKSILSGLSIQSFHLPGDVLDHLGHLHHGLHLLAGVERQQVEELLQAGLGVLQVRVDRDPDVLREKIIILNRLSPVYTITDNSVTLWLKL